MCSMCGVSVGVLVAYCDVCVMYVCYCLVVSEWYGVLWCGMVLNACTCLVMPALFVP